MDNGLPCAMYVVRSTGSSAFYVVPDPCMEELDPRLVKRCLDNAREQFCSDVAVHRLGNGSDAVSVFSVLVLENGMFANCSAPQLASFAAAPGEVDAFWKSAKHIGTLPISRCRLALWTAQYDIESSKK